MANIYWVLTVDMTKTMLSALHTLIYSSHYSWCRPNITEGQMPQGDQVTPRITANTWCNHFLMYLKSKVENLIERGKIWKSMQINLSTYIHSTSYHISCHREKRVPLRAAHPHPTPTALAAATQGFSLCGGGWLPDTNQPCPRTRATGALGKALHLYFAFETTEHSEKLSIVIKRMLCPWLWLTYFWFSICREWVSALVPGTG